MHFYLNKYLTGEGYYISILPRFRVMWFRIPKNAETSTEKMLMDNDPGYVRLNNTGYLKPLYKDYFKFAIFRNPLSRVLSAWKNKVKDTSDIMRIFPKLTFEDYNKLKKPSYFIEFLEGLDLTKCDKHFRLQTSLFENVDYIVRFEEYKDNMIELCDRTGLEFSEHHLNKSNMFDVSPVFKKYKSRIINLYKKDFEFYWSLQNENTLDRQRQSVS